MMQKYVALQLHVWSGMALRMPKVMTSNMVVPAEKPVIFGWASSASATVKAKTSDTGEEVTAVASGPENRFEVHLAPREASLTSFDVTLSEEGSSEELTLTNLLAGDVWVCSGQSNMEFSVAEMFESESVIAEAEHAGLRLFAVQKNSSHTELDDLVDAQYREGWVESSPATVCGSEYGEQDRFCEPHCGPSAKVESFKRDTWGYFSAVCFAHGLELLKATGRPQGLLETSWGGTSIERWSSESALARCSSVNSVELQDEPEPGLTSTGGSGLWAGMVVPLLPIPVRGVIWYQGESNSGTAKANKYACQLQAMIEDWRTRFNNHPLGNFTWITAQLAAAGDHSGGMLRLSQQASTALNGTGVAVAMDLYDEDSPCGAVHIRNKTAVAQRAAKASLALAYGKTQSHWTGPQPKKAAVDKSGLTIDFDLVNGDLAFEAVPGQSIAGYQNFEVTHQDNFTTSAWTKIPAQVVPGTSRVVLNISAVFQKSEAVTWLRYGWGDTPRGEFLYDLGGRAGLPAGPFVADCRSGGSCTFIQGGEVPEPPPEPSPSPSPPAPSPTPAPQPPVPTVSNCTFQNSTTFKDDIYKKVDVPLNDYGACCELCHLDPKCMVAQMHHGPASATVDYCQLMATAEKPTQHVVTPPSLELACIPKERKLQYVTV
jgi:sialate O-acetylesterase